MLPGKTVIENHEWHDGTGRLPAQTASANPCEITRNLPDMFTKADVYGQYNYVHKSQPDIQQHVK